MKGGIKMENKYLAGTIALSIALILGAGFIAAGQFGFGQGMSEEQATQFSEQQDAMQTAMQNKDYATWKSLMEDRISEMQSQITEDNFNTMVEHHNDMFKFREQMKQARKSGDYSKMQELRGEFGVGQGFKGQGNHRPGMIGFR